MCGLLETFWDHKQVVPRQNGYHGTDFPATQGTTQLGLVSQTLFNVVVYNVIWTWFAMTVEDHRVVHDGFGDVFGRCLRVFCIDNNMVGSRDPDCLQHLMDFLVGLFLRYGFTYNIAKSCSITCQPSALMSEISVESKALKCMGVEYSYRVRLQQWMSSLVCVVELTAGLMKAHRHCIHGTERTIYWNRLPVSHTDHHV